MATKHSTDSDTAPARRRRSTEEIIGRIVEAASEEFERNGYAGAKTAAIARTAGVAESLIFSHFESKSRLFQEVVFEPLNRHFLEFRAAHTVADGDRDGLQEHSRQYILELQRFIERHSRLLTSLLVTQLYASDDVQGMAEVDGLQDFFARTTEAVRQRLEGEARIDLNLLARISFATVLACVIFREWLFPEGTATEPAINAAISSFVLGGFNASTGT